MMKLNVLNKEFSVCKLKTFADPSALEHPFFYGITDEEISLVCPISSVPDGLIAREDGWKGFYIEGTLDFSLIGILARISALLAAENVGIFVVSTYNTDYVFVKKENYDHALAALSQGGYEIIS